MNPSQITITVLGCSGSYAAPGNPCTGFVVRSAGATVLFDCGPGTVGPLQETIALEELTAIVVSHCHPDHWLELPVLRNVFTWFHRRSHLPVFGTEQTFEMERAVHVDIPGVDSPFDWTVIDAGSRLEIGDQIWTFDRTDHPVETLAAKIVVGNRTALFTSDSGPGWAFTEFGSEVDIAFCDASHLAGYENLGIPHMSAREAAERAEAAGVRHLVLTHLIPGSDRDAHRAEAVAAYRGPVDVARPGSVFEI